MKMPKVMIEAMQIGAEVISPAIDEFMDQTTDAAVAGAAKCLADIQSRIDTMDDDELLRQTLKAAVQLACGALTIVRTKVEDADDDDDDTPSGEPN